ALGPNGNRVALAPPVTPHALATSAELPSEAVSDILQQAESLARPAATTVRQPLRPIVDEKSPREIPEYLRRKSPWKGILSFAAVAALFVVWVVLAVQKSPLGDGKATPASNEGHAVASTAKGSAPQADEGSGAEDQADAVKKAPPRAARTVPPRQPVEAIET